MPHKQVYELTSTFAMRNEARKQRFNAARQYGLDYWRKNAAQDSGPVAGWERFLRCFGPFLLFFSFFFSLSFTSLRYCSSLFCFVLFLASSCSPPSLSYNLLPGNRLLLSGGAVNGREAACCGWHSEARSPKFVWSWETGARLTLSLVSALGGSKNPPPQF